MAIGRSNAKIILMGEHSVVYQHPAIALPLTAMKLEVEIKPTTEFWLTSERYAGPFSQLPISMNGTRFLLEALMAQKELEIKPFEVIISSQIPEERGMGSSAAVAVALTRAFFAYYKQPLSDEELLDWVSISERSAHGTPSGIDAYTTSSDHPVWFIKNQPRHYFPMNLPGYLVIGDTGLKGQTGPAVGDIRKLREEYPIQTNQKLGELGRLTFIARTAIENNDLTLLGNVMNQAQIYLRELQVSHPTLEILIKTAMHTGAIGAKLTGGGRGGCMIALVPNLKTALKVSENLLAVGAKETWIQTLNEN